MKDVFMMWKNTKMVVLVPLCAALFAASLIPFRAISLIPGTLELRIGNAFPPVLGLLFGPAGAWGIAIGNLITDIITGTFCIYSLSGFLGNFFMAYVPYIIWFHLGLVKKDDPEPYKLNNFKKILNFIFVTIIGTMSGALIISWIADSAKTAPFAFIMTYITITDCIPAIVLGLPVYKVIYGRVSRWRLIWSDIMKEDELPAKKIQSHIGSWMVIIFSISGTISGIIYALNFKSQVLLNAGLSGFGIGNTGSSTIFIIVGFNVVLMFLGTLLRR